MDVAKDVVLVAAAHQPDAAADQAGALVAARRERRAAADACPGQSGQFEFPSVIVELLAARASGGVSTNVEYNECESAASREAYPFLPPNK